jgi:hypothetical protein
MRGTGDLVCSSHRNDLFSLSCVEEAGLKFRLFCFKRRRTTMKAAPSNSDSPLQNRIAAVKSSLRCFVYSLIGLVPLIGIPFAVAAIVRSRQVQKAISSDWNPGDRYLNAAGRIGPLSFLTSAIFLLLVGLVLPAFWRDLGACSFGST